MAPIQHAIIIGCGIGGPVSAMALQRAGIDAAIYEAYDRPADFVGSFLNLASNGIDALRAIGADRPVLDVAFPTPRMVMWNGDGKRLGEVANGIALDDGTTSQTIQRGLLHRTLREEALRRGIRIVPGKRLTSAERMPDGRVLARFDDGTDATAAILIGADGLHSCVRRAIDAAAPSPRDTGLLSIGGRAFDGLSRGTLSPTPETFHMIFGKRAFFGHTVRPCGDVFWFANLLAPASRRGMTGELPPDGGSEANMTTRDAPASASATLWKSRLRELFAEDKGPAIEILDATGDDVAAYPIFDMPAVPTWHAAPMIIIGDAAHATSPSSGQGASLAIEDAVILAQCLRDELDTQRAFASYEQRRRKRVERVVAYSARIGQTKTPGPIGRWFRDRLMPFALRHFASPQAQAWLFRHHIEWDARLSAS